MARGAPAREVTMATPKGSRSASNSVRQDGARRPGEAPRDGRLSPACPAVHTLRRDGAARDPPRGTLTAVRIRDGARRHGRRAPLLLAVLPTSILLVTALLVVVPRLVAVPRAALKAATGVAVTVGSSDEPTGSYTWPLVPPHPVVRGFRPPSSRFGPGHRGVDLATRIGTAVLAAGDGVVVYAGPLAGRGVVSIEHDDGLHTTYEPLEPTAARGDHIARGAVIGHVQPGHPGCRAGDVGLPACLHWGALRVAHGRRSYLNPLTLVGGGEVRLLPFEH